MGDSNTSSATIEDTSAVCLEEDVQPKLLPPYNVVLLDDDDHTYEYVIEMLMKLFSHSIRKSYLMACDVDQAGRVIVDTTTFERAELKQEQIHSFGPDWRLERSAGSMSAVIEPAED